jgi:hypothetical protein
LGVVDKSFITDGDEGGRIAKIRIREVREPNIGDKMASRSGQKGTVGLVIPECDMPFTKDGLRPDIIINPHAIPTRMTIGQLVETITGKAAAVYGGFSDCTAFINNGSKIGVFGEMLVKEGYHSSGNEILYNGMSGEQIDAEIFIGPNYYMRLKHMVKDKINYRASGPRTALTKQPVSGRANDGGLRIGEMERDAVISHGIAEFLRESMMERGDNYQIAVCNNTGMLAIYNPSKNLFMSPMADGPVKFVSSLDGKDMNIEKVTKFGRNFSVVNVPYSFKLLLQELNTCNVQLRIITEDNIEQLENLTFSKNINLLLHDMDITPQNIVNQIKRGIMNTKPDIKTPQQPIAPINQESPDFPETSPAYQESPDYPNVSPAYEPKEDELTDIIKKSASSPPYNPFVSESPPFNPTTPDFSPVNEFNTTAPDYSPSDSFENLSQQANEYSIGEDVYYREDPPIYDQMGNPLPPRLWKIKNIGDKFITIVTNPINSTDTRETQEIVNAMQIYRSNDYSSSRLEQPIQSITGYQGEQYNMTGGARSNPMSIPQLSNPAIHFAPVFKILNGSSDFSADPIQNTDPIPQIGEQLQTTGLINTAPPIQIKKSSDEPTKIDFDKLVIKKV